MTTSIQNMIAHRPDLAYVYRAVVTRVVDGDTVACVVDLGMRCTHAVHLRLDRIDAPESYGARACEAGHEAKRYLTDLLPEGALMTITTRKGKYHGRWIAECWVQTDTREYFNLSEHLVEAGHARWSA